MLEYTKVPQYFAVKNDNTPEFKRFIAWLKSTYKRNLIGTLFSYYGYDGLEFFWNDVNSAKKTVVYESAAEFMKLVDTEEEPKVEKLTISKILEQYPNDFTEDQIRDLKEFGDKAKNLKVPVTNIIGDEKAYFEHWVKENGYVKLAEDEMVVKKNRWETMIKDIEQLNELGKKGAVVLQENQAVITWEKIKDDNFKNLDVWYVDKDFMFKIPPAPKPKARGIEIYIFEDAQKELHIHNNMTDPVTIIPTDWMLIKTIKETI